MLTPYDEFPVHQAPYPFSYMPVTDTGWDDGYYLGAFSPADDVFIYTGMRVNPNVDVIGGYAGIAHGGRQCTVRFSRLWRPDFDLRVGPLRYEVVEAFRSIRVVLERASDLDLAFDFHWLGAAAPWSHHQTEYTGVRRTTDLERYLQAGYAVGEARFAGRTFQLDPSEWFGFRDHSWGLYNQRPPIAADSRWLSPGAQIGPRWAFRFSATFVTAGFSGHCFVHETEAGSPWSQAGAFDQPAGGHVDRGFTHDRLTVRDVTHRLEFTPGTRLLRGGVVGFTDSEGGRWVMRVTLVRPPWLLPTVGYDVGTWRDGGTIQTYHEPREGRVYTESDEFDISNQPIELTTYNGVRLQAWGAVYAAAVEVTDPEGTVTEGGAQVEMFIDGRHDPYGFRDDGQRAPHPWGPFAFVREG